MNLVGVSSRNRELFRYTPCLFIDHIANSDKPYSPPVLRCKYFTHSLLLEPRPFIAAGRLISLSLSYSSTRDKTFIIRLEYISVAAAVLSVCYLISCPRWGVLPRLSQSSDNEVQHVRHRTGPKHKVEGPVSCRTCCTHLRVCILLHL